MGNLTGGNLTGTQTLMAATQVGAQRLMASQHHLTPIAWDVFQNASGNWREFDTQNGMLMTGAPVRNSMYPNILPFVSTQVNGVFSYDGFDPLSLSEGTCQKLGLATEAAFQNLIQTPINIRGVNFTIDPKEIMHFFSDLCSAPKAGGHHKTSYEGLFVLLSEVAGCAVVLLLYGCYQRHQFKKARAQQGMRAIDIQNDWVEETNLYEERSDLPEDESGDNADLLGLGPQVFRPQV